VKVFSHDSLLAHRWGRRDEAAAYGRNVRKVSLLYAARGHIVAARRHFEWGRHSSFNWI
jgi:hypothetical protein